MRVITWAVTAASMLLLAGCTGAVDAETSAPDPTATSTLVAAEDRPGTPSEWRPSDSGPSDGAQGEVTLDADGIPVSYLVAEGDTPDGIRARFDLPWFSLAREDGEFMPRKTMILAGEVLTFTLPN